MVVAEEEEQQIVDNVDCNSHNNNQNDHQNNQQQQQDPNHLSIMDDNLDVNRLLDNPSPQMQQINGLIIDQTNNPTSPSLQRQDSVDIVAKPIPDDKRKRSPVPKDIYPSPSDIIDEQVDGESIKSKEIGQPIKRLKNVSIQELKKDLEKSRQQQRQKLAQQKKKPTGNGVIINGDATIIDMDSKQQPPSPKPPPPSRLSQKKLQVEKLDITAALDVSSVGSATPSPQPPSSVSPILPSDQQTAAIAKPTKMKSKRSQGSVGGIKLTELEMAKLGRLGVQPGGDGGAKGKPGRKSPLPPGKLTPSPKPSAKSSPRPSPRESPIPPQGKKDATDGETSDDKKTRMPRSEMPTRKQRMQQRKEAAAAAAAEAKDGKKPTETDGMKDEQPPSKEHGSSSSSSRSRSRERVGPGGRKLSREMSKDVQGRGSRKQSLLDQSPSSRATKNISDYGHKLVALCRKGDWVGVDTIIKYINKYNVEFDKTAVSETTGWSPLMFAVRDNRIQISEQLIDLGIPINTKAKDGITALHLACAYAREDTIRLLLTNKADAMIPGGEKNQLAIHVLAQKATGAALVPLQLLLKSSPKEVRLAADKDGNLPLFIALENGNHGVCRELLKELPKEQINTHKPETGETAIHIAIRKKDTDMLRLMVDNGGDVDQQNKDGHTALHMAAIMGDEGLIKFLHMVGAKPNIVDKQERTPLHLATENGHMKTVDFLTEKFRASVHERTKDGSTLMHLASAAGHPGTAMVFMKKGVALHMPNKAGAKPIHMAASRGHTEVVKAIVQKGESVDSKTNEGYTALHIAVQSGHAQVVEALIGMGAAVQQEAGKNGETPLHTAARIENGRPCVEMLIKSGAKINAIDANGESPLHFAAREGFLETVDMLLEDQADPSMLNINGENVLHIAAKESHYPIAKRLIEYTIETKDKKSCTELVNKPNKNGESSVHYAANLTEKNRHYENEDRDIMRLLLENGGNVFLETIEKSETPVHYCSKSGNTNALQEIISFLPPLDAQLACNKTAKSGWTPLFYACSRGHADTIRMLLNQNARVDIFDERGQAALHIAAEIGQEEVVEILLESNAFVNVRNKNGMTPLHLAARKGYNNMVKRLVTEHSALLDANTLTKQTPLHLAAEAGQLAVCETLLELKADALAIDNHSQTPLHLAAEHDHSEVVKLFLKHKPDLLSVPNRNGYTCAHIAAAKGSVAVIKELMRLNQDSVINARISKTKSTTLHLAAEGGHVEVVRTLLQAGAKATDENAEGYTALHLAAKKGHVNVLRALKEQSTAYWKVCSRRIGLTALHVAAAFGQTECVSEMLPIVPATIKSERPLIDPSGDYGITPLHLASQSGHENVVRLLLNSKGVQVEAPTEVVGTIPMHMAAQGGHLLVAGLLISRTSEQLHRADKYGRTPLHLAASFGHRDMVSLLLGQGANINSQDNRGWSPLHYASRHGFLDVVQLLVDSGADPDLHSKDGRVPMCCAAGAGHYQVLSYLFKKEHDTLNLMEDRDFLLDLMVCSKQHENKPIQEFILVSSAPIDTAVKLAKSYENLAQKEKDRTRDLETVYHYCDQIATDLLSITATTNNAGRLLRAIDYKGTEFLDVLIELERKEVVAQHAVQQYLTNVWMGTMKWAGWKFIILFFSMLLCPFIWILISCPFGHRLSKMPIIKFTLYLVSHIFFIVILTITTVNPWLPIYMNDGQFPYWHEWLLLVWVLGIFLAEVTNPADRDGLGGIKVVVVSVCFMAVIVHILTVITGYFEYFEEVTRLVMLYLRNQLLAVALLLSFLEFLNFLTFHHLFGPWAVIIRDLIKDLLRFLAILLIFMIGFSLHICAIYQPVFEPPDTVNGTLPSFGQEFQNPLDTFEMLFFALFGLVEPDYMPPMHLSPPVAKIIMKLVFGVYMMVTVIVLINLLIAMMSNTYQRIQAQSDTEWKFGRAKLIRNMTLTSPTPSPINIFIGLPYQIMSKLLTLRQDRKKGMHITAALAHRPSVVATQKWLQSGAGTGAVAAAVGGAGGRRASRATSHISRTFGQTYADDTETQKPITEVINWPVIVKKYLEYIGAIGADTGEEDDKDNSQMLIESPTDTSRPMS
ncbi:LOW QUALITY PROTEIN: uncharacterized protein LOC113794122 [Dermatophagoides pteronyssinus]|uniref:LOW QUALITY PROTEIN: uncharacterized protein LOC113794122 n=1 Tax=Dermatophagoides pteronyssinus TaxID=6956 RepID=UPI003F67A7EA